MTILRGLLLSSKPRHLRDLSAQYLISPAGVSDIIRRLSALGILRENRDKNKIGYTLICSDTEAQCLKNMFLIYQRTQLEQRSVRFSKNAIDKFKWIDESAEFYRQIRITKKTKRAL
jgi:DNA-binding MarR family transcriptional regulator